MSARVCSFEGCGRPAIAKGLCAAHRAQQAAGKELRPIRFRKRPEGQAAEGRPCSFETCGRPAKAKGLCISHRTQQRAGKELTPIRHKSNSPYSTEPPLPALSHCEIPDCSAPVARWNVCERHYSNLASLGVLH